VYTAVETVVVVALLVAMAVCLWAGLRLDRRLRASRRLRTAVVAGSGAMLAVDIVLVPLPSSSPWRLAWAMGAVLGLTVAVVAALSLRIESRPARSPRRVLALGAHPDDLELGCGATIAKLTDGGHEVHAIVMSDGASGGSAAERPDEARVGARFLGLSSVRLLGLPDTVLDDHAPAMVTAIEHAISAIQPDLILTHSRHDQHQDHQAVHTATLRAARSHSSILCFESPSVTRQFAPSLFVEIDDYVDVKVAAVRAHRDQLAKPYMSGERVRGTAVFRGIQAKRRYAEAFEPVRVLGTAMGEL
jgi:LmbE family N-acetylglucosaminyl deacetylase